MLDGADFPIYLNSPPPVAFS